MEQQSQLEEDPMDALAHAAQKKLFTPGEEPLTDWEMGLVLHHWTIQRITAQLATTETSKLGAIKRQSPGAAVGAVVVALIAFVWDVIRRGG